MKHSGGMEVTIRQRGRRDDDDEISEAIRQVSDMVDAEDLSHVAKRAFPEAQAEEGEKPGEGECPECARGTCDDPEHMAEEDMAALMAD